MLAGLQVKHAHMRGGALSRSLLVIDEVHASDTYMTEVLKQLLDGHLEAGGYAMLMSATLGARARVRWTGENHALCRRSNRRTLSGGLGCWREQTVRTAGFGRGQRQCTWKPCRRWIRRKR